MLSHPIAASRKSKSAARKKGSVQTSAARRGAKSAVPAPKTHLKADELQADGRTTKQEHVLTLLSRPGGASVDEMMQATDWQQHSVRGFLAGTVKKKLGLTLVSAKSNGQVRRYRVQLRRGR